MENQKKLRELIENMSITDVMNVVGNDERVLILNWFYPSHLAAFWDIEESLVERQMSEINEMFRSIVGINGIDTTSEIIEQQYYLEEWEIATSEEEFKNIYN